MLREKEAQYDNGAQCGGGNKLQRLERDLARTVMVGFYCTQKSLRLCMENCLFGRKGRRWCQKRLLLKLKF